MLLIGWSTSTGDVHEYTITGLHPGRKYDVRVLPGTMNVASQWYPIEMPRVAAVEGSTSSPVANTLTAPAVELVAANGTSVLVTWEDMGPSSGHRVAEGMLLTYRIQGSRDTHPAVRLPPSGSQRIAGLKAGSIYEFQMVAVGSRGDDQEGPATSTTIRTLWQSGIEHEEEDVDSESRPIRMEAKPLTSQVILVTWHPLPPESLSNFLYYTVRYVALKEEEQKTPSSDLNGQFQFVRSTGHQVNLTNLTPHTLYRINVRCHDRQGRSSTYNNPAVSVRTLVGLPGPPLDLSFTVSDGGMAQLTWKPPSPANGIILGYVLLISSDPQAPVDTWIRQEDDGLLLRSQFAGLVPGTVYYVRMQAKTSAGWGPLTGPLTFSFPFPAASSGYGSDKYIVTLIGLAIGIGLILTFTMSIFFIFRTRCIKRMSSDRSGGGAAAGSGVVLPATDQMSRSSGTASGAVANGLPVACNGFHHRHKQRSSESMRRNGGAVAFGDRRDEGSLMEMEAFVPMLATIPVEEISPHLDTKGGYPIAGLVANRHSHQDRESSLSNGSLRRGYTDRVATEGQQDDEDEDVPADESGLPLMSLQSNDLVQLNGTILSQATETTCLSLDYSGRNRRKRRKHQQRQRQGSLHSHDSSLHSLDSRSSSGSSGSGGGHSLRGGPDGNDETIGICHHADHQMNDSGLVVAVVTGSSNNNRTCSTPKGSRSELVIAWMVIWFISFRRHSNAQIEKRELKSFDPCLLFLPSRNNRTGISFQTNKQKP